MHLRERISRRIGELAPAGLLRQIQVPRGIDLCSNDYLGLAQFMSEGCGSTGSRLLRGEQTEAALYFSSGYMANIAVLATFLEPGDIVFSDELNHSSLIDGIRLGRARKCVFPHADGSALRRQLGDPCSGQRFIVTESIFSMDGDIAPLDGYARLAESAGAALIVDEAHAVGVFGERGSGCIEARNIGAAVLLSINPMGKAFGCAGAFVCGPAWAIEYLAQRGRPFVFSTAPPPSVAAALEAALDLIEQGAELRERVLSQARGLRALLAERGFGVDPDGSQIVPVVIGGNSEAVSVAASLQNAGFDVRAIRPPTVPEGTARLRISVNAGLTEKCFAPIRGCTIQGRTECGGRMKIARTPGIFVTGTDTNVGKTALCAALVCRYRRVMPVRYWKPVQTGSPEDDDTAVVRKLASCTDVETHDCGVRLPRPLSPHLSARLAGERIEIASIR